MSPPNTAPYCCVYPVLDRAGRRTLRLVTSDAVQAAEHRADSMLREVLPTPSGMAHMLRTVWGPTTSSEEELAQLFAQLKEATGATDGEIFLALETLAVQAFRVGAEVLPRPGLPEYFPEPRSGDEYTVTFDDGVVGTYRFDGGGRLVRVQQSEAELTDDPDLTATILDMVKADNRRDFDDLLSMRGFASAERTELWDETRRRLRLPVEV